MKNNGFATATNCFTQKFHNTFQSTKANEVEHFFNHLFSIEDIVDKNTFVLLYFQNLASRKKFDAIHRIMCDNALQDFHPSCLYTMLLMTNTIEQLKDATERLRNLYNSISKKY